MTRKYLFPTIIVVSLLFLSACDRLDQAKTELLNQTLTPTPTDNQLQKELESDTGPNIDQDLNDLEKALQ